MKTLMEILTDDYTFSMASMKWISEPGKLLELIGHEVMFIDYQNEGTEEEENWTTKSGPALIQSIEDFDPSTRTYNIKYVLLGKDQDHETKEERIFPAGFSFNQPDESGWMHRFVPYSLHWQMMEEKSKFDRYTQLFSERETLGIEGLELIRDQKNNALSTFYNFALIIKSKDDKIFGFRINGVRGISKADYGYSFTVLDSKGNQFPVRYLFEDDKFTKAIMRIPGEGEIGEVKILDLQDA